MTLQERFSEENTKNKLISKIEKAYGKDHKIKIAIFKANSEYNDEGYDYNPNLILIDSNFNEINHRISLHDLVPDEEEQWDNDNNEEIMVEDLTIKF